MKTHTLLALVGLATGFSTPAFSQTAPKELVGTRTLVSITVEYDDKEMDFFGANPQGQLTFDPNGRFSVIITRSDVPKFATKSRDAGTSEENKAAVQGSIAYFGTYSVSEAGNVIRYHIDGSTYPKLTGHRSGTIFQTFGRRTHLNRLCSAHRCWNRLLGLEGGEAGHARRTEIAHFKNVETRRLPQSRSAEA
jgi:hypothetical protein